ncbi:RdxH [Defluviimonas sp. 20V17]|uniref:Nitrogen fixation protein FixH n=1 Tax=Allgaiera indica TaxID=765699 RepID=A0AAN4ZYC8_9RHOB|nr:FixH family protein [Allgaiera indica]KDB01812.1 RdxH [Defluviimonas sp. 20V17]GHD98915.1 RdxH [Allgaiera indica]SDW03564.1 Nitrogen fixation protein FixH [Allgaiera indica]
MAPLTGRKVLAIFVAAFSVIIGVNLLLAYQAVHSFPGLEVENGYVASQSFNRDMKAQKALGWTVQLGYESGVLTVDVDRAPGSPADVASLGVLVGRPTEAKEDKRPSFTRRGDRFSAPVELRRGKWMVVISAQATNGTHFKQRLSLVVPG